MLAFQWGWLTIYLIYIKNIYYKNMNKLLILIISFYLTRRVNINWPCHIANVIALLFLIFYLKIIDVIQSRLKF
jgi:hypothetical protein